MDYNELVKNLKFWANSCDRTNFGCQGGYSLNNAAAAITDLMIENQAMRNAANGFKERAEAAEARAEKAENERDSVRATLNEILRCGMKEE